MVCLLGLAVSLSAQGNSNSRLHRSINELRQSGCAASFFQGNSWEIYATLEGIVRCEVAPSVDGLGDVYLVWASIRCREGEPCPAVADFILGRVFWCGNDIVGSECLRQ
jgi:hypothetical protein